jgi:hypothetical protein
MEKYSQSGHTTYDKISSLFVASSGNAADELIMQYIELQGKEPDYGNFEVEGEL